MGRSKYDDDTKAAVMAALLEGQSIRSVAEEYDIPRGTVGGWARKAREQGVSGVSDTKKEEIGELLTEYLAQNLKALQKDLKSQSYSPNPVRRTYIPKGDGRERPLGIPTIRDRIVQESLRMVLEPIYESVFSDYSLGFRPNRCTLDAVRLVQTKVVTSNMMWVIDADIKGFFDNVE